MRCIRSSLNQTIISSDIVRHQAITVTNRDLSFIKTVETNEVKLEYRFNKVRPGEWPWKRSLQISDNFDSA